MKKLHGKALGGQAKNAKMTPEERKAHAESMAEAKRERSLLPRAEYYGTLQLGEVEIQCAVLPDGSRVLSQMSVVNALGRANPTSRKNKNDTEQLPSYLSANALKPFINKELSNSILNPILYIPGRGGNPAQAIPAAILPQICDVYLRARDASALTVQQEATAKRAEILMRGLAHVGIIALVDEATGYQRERTRDALAKILEAYVAKELQPWVKTFDSDYYENMFRLRGIKYPPEKSNYRPSYFGHLTNDVVYSRLAPGVLAALKEEAKKEEKRTHLHRHLTAGYGRQELLKHLGMVVGFMKVSKDWDSFIGTLDRVSTKFNKTFPLELVDKP